MAVWRQCFSFLLAYGFVWAAAFHMHGTFWKTDQVWAVGGSFYYWLQAGKSQPRRGESQRCCELQPHQRADGTSVAQKHLDFSSDFLGEWLELLVWRSQADCLALRHLAWCKNCIKDHFVIQGYHERIRLITCSLKWARYDVCWWHQQ